MKGKTETQTGSFLSKFLGKRVLVRTMSDRPYSGMLADINTYEIEITEGKKKVIIFKHSIATLEEANG
jgi:hypothetical protein